MCHVLRRNRGRPGRPLAPCAYGESLVGFMRLEFWLENDRRSVRRLRVIPIAVGHFLDENINSASRFSRCPAGHLVKRVGLYWERWANESTINTDQSHGGSMTRSSIRLLARPVLTDVSPSKHPTSGIEETPRCKTTSVSLSRDSTSAALSGFGTTPISEIATCQRSGPYKTDLTNDQK